MRVLDLRGNIEEVDWDKDVITIFIEESNIRVSKNGKLVCLFFIYKRRNTGNDSHDNTGPKTTES